MITFAKFYFANTNILHDSPNFSPTKVSLSVKHCVYQKLAADKDETMEEL